MIIESNVRVYVLTIDHRTGYDISVCGSEATAEKILAQYCQENWESEIDADDEEELGGKPETDETLVEAYFHIMGERDPGEWYRIEELPIRIEEEVQ